MRLADLIPAPYRLVAGFALVAGVSGFLGYVHHHIAQGGYDRCKAEIAGVTQDARDKAQANLTKVEKKYEPRIKELQAAPDSDGFVGPLTSRAIDGLP